MDASQRRDAAAMAAAFSEPMADAFALIGPESRCLERLEQYRKQGGELPIIVPTPVGEDYVTGMRRALKVFAKAN
jgi:alkanesulfonate monooxygenase SsuD/methylene tetrahydromethanopterin reductase-like flavin-dependent oxidoreductase (luciferase family)